MRPEGWKAAVRQSGYRRLATAAAIGTLVACASLTGPGVGRAADDPARMDRLERQVRELRAIVFQARDTGHPVEVRDAGPDPAVSALAQRVDDLEATLRKLQGGNEQSTHDVEVLRAGLDQDRSDRTTQIQALTDRLARVESQLVTVSSPPPPPPALDAKGHRQAAAAAAAAVPPTGETNPGVDTLGEFKTARTLLASGDYGGASQAFQAFVSTHPSDLKAPEAYYWLGESYSVRDLNGDATSAYARALKGWPKSTWAPDAVIKLSRALAATQRNPEACAALGEFARRYEKSATPSARTRAAQTKDKLGCAG
jgi:tol-pal system protein YbgF